MNTARLFTLLFTTTTTASGSASPTIVVGDPGRRGVDVTKSNHFRTPVVRFLLWFFDWLPLWICWGFSLWLTFVDDIEASRFFLILGLFFGVLKLIDRVDKKLDKLLEMRNG